MTFYNEFDAQKAAWLRELMNAGEITTGEVDERSIKDLGAGEIAAYGRLHFFAGIGVWDYALRLAGWPADWPIWTASCPCQPFSSAGRRGGIEDDRHLWPWLMGLIAERHPHVVIGEQVSSPDGLAWFDIVRTDLEAAGYACGSLDTCAAGVGAPHARQRLYWCALRLNGLADSYSKPSERNPGGVFGAQEEVGGSRVKHGDFVDGHCGGSPTGWLADSAEERLSQRDGEPDHGGQGGGPLDGSERLGFAGLVGHATGRGCGERGDAALAGSCGYPDGAGGADGVGDSQSSGYSRGGERNSGEKEGFGGLHFDGDSGFTRGHWARADWVLTRPQRVGDLPGLRPIEPGALPLADGAAARVGRLRGYGDAIVAQQAAAFVRCVMEEIMQRITEAAR